MTFITNLLDFIGNLFGVNPYIAILGIVLIILGGYVGSRFDTFWSKRSGLSRLLRVSIRTVWAGTKWVLVWIGKPLALLTRMMTGGAVIVLIMTLINVGVFALMTKLETGVWFKPHDTFSVAIIFAFLGYLYTVDAIARGFRTENQVPEDEIGLRLFKGLPLDTVGSGPPVLPRGLVSLRTEKRKVHQREFPDNPENIYRGEMKPDPEHPDRPIIPEGMKPPVRITFGTSITDAQAKELFGEGDDGDYTVETPDGRKITFDADVPEDGLSNKRVTAEPVPFIRYRIIDLRAFVQNIGDFDEADRQIEDTMFAVIMRYYTRMSAAQALHNIDWMNALLFRRLEHRTGAIPGKSLSWGVDIEDTNMKLINFNHDLNQSIADAARADFVAQKMERESKGEKIQITNRGEGEANAARMKERETLKGRASGVRAIAKETEMDADEVYGGLVAAEITKGEGTTFIPGLPGLKDLAGAAAAVFGKKSKE